MVVRLKGAECERLVGQSSNDVGVLVYKVVELTRVLFKVEEQQFRVLECRAVAELRADDRSLAAGPQARILRADSMAGTWEICGDQLCIVVHREAFGCNGRLSNLLITKDLASCLEFC